MLIKRTEREKHRGSFAAFASELERASRSPRLPAPLGPCRRRSRRAGRAAARQRAQGEGRPAARARRRGHHPQEHLHALRGWLHGYCGSIQWRMDRPGAELGQPDQSRLALRQRAPRCASWCTASAGSNIR